MSSGRRGHPLFAKVSARHGGGDGGSLHLRIWRLVLERHRVGVSSLYLPE